MPSIEVRKNIGRGIFLVVGLFVLLHCLAALIYVARQPWKGFNVFDSRRVATVYRDSYADHAGILPGDIVLSIDNHTIRNSVDVVRITPSLLTVEDGRGNAITVRERAVPVVFQHEDNAPVTKSITIVRTPFPLMLLAWFLVCVGVIATAYGFYLRRSEDTPTGLFFLMCVIYCGAFMDAFAWNAIISNVALISAAPFWGALLAPVTLHFFLVYPQTNVLVRRSWWLTILIYLPSAVYLVLMGWLMWRLTGLRYDPEVAPDIITPSGPCRWGRSC